ncbi:MAG: hypothetical protein LBL07_04120 [Tannerella sp.]|nr:hypothetical protein [Tannerella sp.]
MKKQDDVFKRFYESFRNMEGHFHILEHRIPVEQQMKYFKYSDRIRKKTGEMTDVDYERYMADLKDNERSEDEKKTILSKLALSKQVRAYRLLEQYVQHPDPELVNWACMALMESRITLESELSGEKQIYISTGLGGKGQKLRFYVLILSSEGKPFLDYQRKVIEKEFGYTLPKADYEIEQLVIGDQYVELVFLVPVRADIKKILEDVIRECNLYGNFLSEIFTVTNVKELSPEEVSQIVEKYGRGKTGR